MEVAQSFLTRCDTINYTLHGILQARILEWVAFPFSRGSSQPRDPILVSNIAGGFFTNAMSTRNKYELMSLSLKKKKINTYSLLFIWLHWVLVVAWGIFSCSKTSSCWLTLASRSCGSLWERHHWGLWVQDRGRVLSVMWPQLHHMPSSYPSYFTYLCFVSSLVSPAWP